MPTGRPDYWYGTALYFEDSPADGEVTRGPTSNWAYDHAHDESAHHSATCNRISIMLGIRTRKPLRRRRGSCRMLRRTG